MCSFMEILKALAELDGWLIKWEAAKEGVRKDVLRITLESCRALTSIDDISSDKGILLQEKVRTLYRNVTSILDGRLKAEEIETVINALASARIYYWIRFYEMNQPVPIEEVYALIRRRGYINRGGSSRVVEEALCAMCPDEMRITTPDNPLEALRRACIRDFAELEVLASKHGLTFTNPS